MRSEEKKEGLEFLLLLFYLQRFQEYYTIEVSHLNANASAKRSAEEE